MTWIEAAWLLFVIVAALATGWLALTVRRLEAERRRLVAREGAARAEYQEAGRA